MNRWIVALALAVGPGAAAQGNPEAWVPASVSPSVTGQSVYQLVFTDHGLVALTGGSGTFRSDDGDVWGPLAPPVGVHVLWEAAARAGGPLVIAGQNEGGDQLYRLSGGTTWEPLAALPDECPRGVVYRILAMASEALVVGTGCGWGQTVLGEVFLSTDGGATLTRVSGPETGYGPVVGLAGAAERLYASRAWGGFEGGAPGVQRSDDGGATWAPTATESPAGGRDMVVSGGAVLIEGLETIYRSVDGGSTWEPTDVAMSPLRPYRAFLTTADGAVYLAPGGPFEVAGTAYAGGLLRTRDGGLAWSVLDDGLGALAVTALAADAEGHLHAATYDPATETVEMFRTAGRVVGAEAAPPEVGLALAVAPNPVSGTARLSFALAAPSDVSLVVADVLGRRVATVAAGAYPAGPHEVAWSAAALPAGVYAVTLRAEGRAETHRVTVTR